MSRFQRIDNSGGNTRRWLKEYDHFTRFLRRDRLFLFVSFSFPFHLLLFFWLVMNSAFNSCVNAELPLLGIVSADIVVSGGRTPD
jgi:hypothetical protein